MSHFPEALPYNYGVFSNLAVNKDGFVYVSGDYFSNSNNCEIHKYTSVGAFITKWTAGHRGSGTAVDIDGNIYISSDPCVDGACPSQVMKYTADGEFVNSFDIITNYGREPAIFEAKTTLAIDRSGNIYATVFGSDTHGYLYLVQVYNSDGELLVEKVETYEGIDRDSIPYAIAVDDNGMIYVLESGDRVAKYMLEDSAGKLVVNTTGDESDADKGDGVCDVDLSKDGDQCTLRAAIEEVNLSTDVDAITFDIPTTDIGYSNTGTATFSISPEKALPKIKKSLVIDGTSQSDGKIALDGSNAGGTANGLYVSKGNLTVKGISISGFSRNGILNNGEGWIGVENLEITNNERYGILADGNVYINSATQQLTLSSTGTVTVTISGNGDEEDGGGARSLKKSIIAKSVEVTDNYGPGIVAKKYIDLKKIKINNNRGPGIQSMTGKITIIGATSDYSDGNEVNENEGPGIMSGTKMFFQALGDSSSIYGDKIDIQTHITVSNNAGWGIFGRGVEINRRPGFWVSFSPYTSVISGNGDKGKNCYIVNETGKLVKINVYGGGIGSEFTIRAARIEVTDNQGPGIVAKETIDLMVVKSNNNKGPGIQSMRGKGNNDTEGITISSAITDFSDVSEVNGNEGPGIMSGTEMYFQDPGDNSNINGGKIDIRTHITVSNNAGWGIFGNRVIINRINEMTSGFSPYTSVISGNGDKGKNCYFVDIDGELRKVNVYGGGIGSDSYINASNIDVTDNQGPGIVAKNNMDLTRVQRINNNHGPGIQSMDGSIMIVGKEGESDGHEVSGNYGPGIFSGTDMETHASYGKSIYVQNS